METQPIVEQPAKKSKNILETVKVISIIAGVLVLLFILLVIFTKKPEMKEDNIYIKGQIDSLSKVNQTLKAKQDSMEDLSRKYEDAILDLDYRIQNVGESKTIIREVYHDKIKQPAKYTPKQLDGFFKKRYNY